MIQLPHFLFEQFVGIRLSGRGAFSLNVVAALQVVLEVETKIGAVNVQVQIRFAVVAVAVENNLQAGRRRNAVEFCVTALRTFEAP